MAELTPIPLTPFTIGLDNPLFDAICGWPYSDPFVGRLLREDVPQRVLFGNCRVWVYREPAGDLVGFGTLDVCDDYADYTLGRGHPYIPLLAVNPTVKSRGYGTSIVRHLVDEAALLAYQPGGCHNVLFLDVYITSERAIRLYSECGFQVVEPEPRRDDLEGGRQYLVMARSVMVPGP